MYYFKRLAGNCGYLVVFVGLLLVGCSDNRTPAADQGVADRGPGADGAPDSGVDGTVAQEGGVNKEAGPVPDVGQPDAKLPARWVLVNAPNQPTVAYHRATLMKGGQVLVTGGTYYDENTQVTTIFDQTYLYLPVQKQFASAGKMTEPREEHTATALDDGRVLVVGGKNDNAYLKTAEIYDPSQPAGQRWKKVTDMFASRWGHAAVKLADGRVLVTGGFASSDSTSSVTIFNPKTNAWQTPAASMNVERRGHEMLLLSSGKVLIVGGLKGKSNWTWESHDSLEVFDPQKGTFTLVTDKMSKGRNGHTVTLMGDGRVLIVGGICWGTCANMQQKDDIYDPVTGKLTPLAHPGSSAGLPSAHAAALLADGRVMVIGSNKETTADMVVAFSPSTGGMWDTLPKLNIGRWGATATRLADNTVLLVGGVNKSSPYTYATAAELYHP